MRRATLVVTAGLLAGCPGAPEPAAPNGSSGRATAVEPAATTASDDGGEGTGPSPTATAATGEPPPWLEVGWGTTEFASFEGTLPVQVGPQGRSMFSMPIRGFGFYSPPDPSFDNPDMPMMQAWVDIEGYELTAGGHFNEVVDYPALFLPSLDDGAILEGPAVWLVLPDGVDPQAIVGETAFLHAELRDRDGLTLVDEHELVVGDVPAEPGGP